MGENRTFVGEFAHRDSRVRDILPFVYVVSRQKHAVLEGVAVQTDVPMDRGLVRDPVEGLEGENLHRSVGPGLTYMLLHHRDNGGISSVLLVQVLAHKVDQVPGDRVGEVESVGDCGECACVRLGVGVGDPSVERELLRIR